MTVALAVYGKHPAKGDFLEFGVPEALKPALEGWLDGVLGEARTVLGMDWDAVWPAAPMLRFWLGEGVWGSPVAGVLASSQDRVGRRFPLVLLLLGDASGSLPPPVIDPDQTWYDAACTHLLAQLSRPDLPGPADLLEGAPMPLGADTPPGPCDFWAVQPGSGVGGLLSDIAQTDHRRCAGTRSYWWVAGSRDAEPVVEAEAEMVSVPETVPESAPESVHKPLDDADRAATTEPVEADAERPAPVEPDAESAEVDATEADDWALPAADPVDDASPFDAPPGGFSLFAAPEQGVALAEQNVAQPVAYSAPAAPRQIWSQVWAGPGLPPGAVMAWFFRGHAGND